MRAYLIANPKAGRGAVGGGWEAMLATLHRAGLEPEGDLTNAPGHATELARAARRDGRELVVAVGGDGTVHEVVNGLLADGPGDDVPVLGVIAAGSGCDYVKTFDLPTDLDGAAARLASPDPPRSVDVGEVTFVTAAGEQTRLFANIAEVGIGPEVVARAATLPRWLGGAVYLAAFWLTLPRFTERRSTIELGGASYEGGVTNLVVANGRVFGGGMRIAPSADPGDGLFDVQIHRGSKVDYVVTIPKVFSGSHLPHDRIDQHRSGAVEVRCDPPGLIEADGEVLGRTPASFRVIPGALRLKV